MPTKLINELNSPPRAAMHTTINGTSGYLWISKSMSQ